jgi:hypothetical protein
MLMMSATPIPRTLAMSYYADLDVSTIDELPPGRTPIVTKVVADSRRAQVVDRIRAQLAQGPEFEVPRRPRPRAHVRVRGVDTERVVDEHVAGPRREGDEPAPRAERVDLVPRLRAEAMAAGQEPDRVVCRVVEVDPEAVDRSGQALHREVLVHGDRFAVERGLVQHVLPGQQQLVGALADLGREPHQARVRQGDEEARVEGERVCDLANTARAVPQQV